MDAHATANALQFTTEQVAAYTRVYDAFLKASFAHALAVGDYGTATTAANNVETGVNNARKSWQDAGVHKSGADGYVSLINVLVLEAINGRFLTGANTDDPEGCVDILSTSFQIEAGQHFGLATNSFTTISGLRNDIDNNAIIAL